MNNLKNFVQFLNESKGNLDIEGILHNALGDDYLDNREDILANIGNIISDNSVDEAMYQIMQEYPMLADYESELLNHIGAKEGSFNMKQSPYDADVAIENLLMKLMPIRFIEEKDEILDVVYSTLSSGWVSDSIDQIVSEYPELEGYEEELIQAANTEGYND